MKDKNNSFVLKKTLKVCEAFIVVLVALLIYIGWYKLNIYQIFSFAYIHFSIAHIGYLCLLFIPVVLVFQNQIIKRLWIFFSSLALLDLPPLMYIVNEKTVDKNIFTSSINITIIIFLIILSITYENIKPLSKNDIQEYKKNIWVIFVSALSFFAIYHGVNYYLGIIKNIPNESRSIFINELEFHHINYGIFLLILVPIFVKYILSIQYKLIRVLLFIFIGFIYGTIYDESFYYMLQNMTDSAYLELFPTLLSIVIMLMSILFWYYCFFKRKLDA